MSPLFGPILAQVITLGVADRTEARYIVTDTNYAEAITAPRVGLNFGWRRVDLGVGYGPTVTVTPLGSSRELLLLHTGVVAATYRTARTTVTLSQTAVYGELNFRAQALGDPSATGVPNPAQPAPIGGSANPPPNTPPPVTTPGPVNPTPGSVPNTQNYGAFQNQAIPFASSATDLTVANEASKAFTVRGSIGYVVSGSVGPEKSENYPVVKGPRAAVGATYHPTRRDDVTTTLTTQWANVSATGNNAWLLIGNETWAHRIDRNTSTTLGAGLSITRNSQRDGLVYYTIYPTFNSGIATTQMLARGLFTVGTSVSATPFIDPIRARVDPRLRIALSAAWTRDRFTASVTGGSAISLARDDGPNSGSLNSVVGAAGIAYLLGSGFSIDTGVRGFWQSFESSTTVPATYAVFVGLSYAASLPLTR